MNEPQNDHAIDLSSEPLRALPFDLAASWHPTTKDSDAAGAKRLLVTEVLV